MGWSARLVVSGPLAAGAANVTNAASARKEVRVGSGDAALARLALVSVPLSVVSRRDLCLYAGDQ